jgi:4a-hydroxytetrahydrobiopterin dehydratase
MDLTEKRCVACSGDVPHLEANQVSSLLAQLSEWRVSPGDRKLRKQWKFQNFARTMRFVNRLAELAESEGHHPDFCVHYNVLDVSLTTHSIDGLSENDFILAAKIDQLSLTS